MRNRLGKAASLLLILFWVHSPAARSARAAEIEWSPEARERSVGIVSFKLSRERAQTFHGWLSQQGLTGVRRLTAKEIESGELDHVELLIVPSAPRLPAAIWKKLPEFHARGGHLLFEGVPLATGHTGSGKFVPGIGPDLHLFYELKHLPGLAPAGQRVTLRAYPELGERIPFEPRTLISEGGGWRSIQTWVRRYKGNSRGAIEFRDDIEFLPFAFYSNTDQLLAQQAVLVRHHCRLFNEASTIFVDISATKNPSFRLLDRKSGPAVLSTLVQLAFARLPGERSEQEYATLLELKAHISTLRDRFVEGEYLSRDLLLLSSHVTPSMAAPTALAALDAVSGSILDLLDEFEDWRTERSERAWREFPRLLERATQQLAEVESPLAMAKSQREALLARATPLEVPLPGGKLTYGFASTPVLWGYKDRYMLQAMKEAGMESYTDWAFDADELRRLGFTKISLYEFFRPMPKELEEQLSSGRGRMRKDPETGEVTYKRGEVTPVLSPAFESRAYADFLETEARRYAEEPWINARVISVEKILDSADGYDSFPRDRFREFLRRRHETPAQLNARWKTRYASFDEIQLPDATPRTQPEHALWYDWVEFRTEAVTRYFKRIYETYRRHDSMHHIVMSINQWSPLSGIDFFALNEFQDRVSCHNTPSSLPWYLPGLAHRRGQRGENNEAKAEGQPYRWAPENERGVQWKVRFHSLYSYARGVAEFEEWSWGSTLKGLEEGKHGTGMLGEVDGFFRLAGAEAKHFQRWKRSWEAFSGATPPHEWAELGLYWSFATKSHGNGRDRFPKRRSDDFFWSSFKIMDRWNFLLDALHTPFETVTRQKVKAGAIDHLKLIVVPQATYLESRVMKELLAYVERGGQLLVVGASGRYDEYGVDSNLLFRAAGVHHQPEREHRVRVGDRFYLASMLTSLHNGGASFLHFSSLAAEVEPLHRFGYGKIAALRARHGDGSITFLGFSPSADERAKKGILSAAHPLIDLLEDLFTHAKIRRPIVSADPQVRLATSRSDDGWFFSAVQNYGAERKTARLAIPGRIEHVADVALGIALSHHVKNGENILELPLLEADGRIIAWKPAHADPE